MSRRLEWTSRAIRRVEEIGVYFAKDSPTAAERVTTRLQAAPESLSTHRAIGRTGRITGTRELLLADIPYIIAHRVTETSVEVLTVMHTSQRWPEAL